MLKLSARIALAVCAAAACMLTVTAPREGDSSPATLRYVALGDSIAASTSGFGVTTGYVARYAASANADLLAPIEVTNLGVNATTSSDLLSSLQTSGPVRDALSDADIVTWNIGFNDLHQARLCYVYALGCGTAQVCGGADNQDCFRSALSAFQANWDAVVAEVQALTSSHPLAVIRTMDIYNPFVGGEPDPGTRAVVTFYFQAFNAHIHASSVAAGIPVARVSAAFNGEDGTAIPGAPPREFLDPDGVHPNNAGAAAIASALRDLGYAPYAYDADGDMVFDPSDNCPDAANPDQANSDGNLIVLAPVKPYNDHSRPASDELGDECDTDDDNDGRTDAAESSGAGCGPFIAPTDPRSPDTDGDNFRDGPECVLGADPNDIQGRPALLFCGSHADSDRDGITNNREVCYYGTDPLNANSDGDSCSDGKEMASINRSGTVEVVDVQQVAFAYGPYQLPGTAVEVDFDMTKNGAIDVIDLQQLAARFGDC